PLESGLGYACEGSKTLRAVEVTEVAAFVAAVGDRQEEGAGESAGGEGGAQEDEERRYAMAGVAQDDALVLGKVGEYDGQGEDAEWIR
ncbi:MAG: hypothetical protein Q9193_005496, partial [Seirophora villosa]